MTRRAALRYLRKSTVTSDAAIDLHSDAGSFFRTAFDLQASAVETGNLVAQGEAEAGAALLAGAGFIYHIERLCDPAGFKHF